MHYIRFLKAPSVIRQSKDSRDLHLTTKITITTDLGESFLCVDLPILVILLDEKGLRFQSRPYRWKAGNRQLEITFSLGSAQGKSGSLRQPFRVLIQPQAAYNRPDTLFDLLSTSVRDGAPGLVLPVISLPLSSAASTDPPKRALRLLGLANGEAMNIWEETGESIARHIWYVKHFRDQGSLVLFLAKFALRTANSLCKETFNTFNS